MSVAHSSLEDYKRAGFSRIMGWGTKPALLVIDVCKAYWTEGSPLDLSHNPAAAAAPDSMRKLLAAAREGNVPVLWSEVQYVHPEMLDAGLFYKKSEALTVWQKGDGRALHEHMDGLSPAPNDIIVTKQYASAFFGTSLASSLNTLGVDTVVIVGVSTSGCVRATALDAMQHGFRPMVSVSFLPKNYVKRAYSRYTKVVGSACGDRSPEIHDANMFDLNAKYADAVTEEEAVERLRTGWQDGR